MATTSRTAKLPSGQTRMMRKVSLLSKEVERLSSNRIPSDDLEIDLVPTRLHGVTKPEIASASLDSLLDKAMVLTQKWEKIFALLALITTNLSGNKSLGALLEIMAKYSPPVPQAATAAGSSSSEEETGNVQASSPASASGSSMNITELLKLAETVLKGAQQTQAGSESQDNQPETEVIETETTVVSDSDVTEVENEHLPENEEIVEPETQE